ncbi:prepilin peptidase [Bombilactobacillus folatiphilus]|uniref:Prepilin peptidase n=1 Tax=Bombilactobacillus folatiphilus TaxID=2923362 RepID=A0ABY4P9P3_9LACO|nr:A24 family peptidase [Bombilactobacillus folatiphilus]UQS82346.1 prepilin peptidase [Bombilactobacillus folatiphilus]
MIIFELLFSICLASFAGVTAIRLPLGYSIVQGRSRCDICKHQLKWYQEIPLISYICLRGQCAYCHHRIHRGIFIIELLGLCFGIEAINQTMINPFLFIIVAVTLTLGAFTDYYYLNIWPLTLIPAVISCLILNFPNWSKFLTIILFSLTLASLYFLFKGHFGLGDCEILLLLILAFDLQTVLQIILLATFFACLGFLVLYQKYRHRIILPFVPFILAGIFIRFLF